MEGLWLRWLSNTIYLAHLFLHLNYFLLEDFESLILLELLRNEVGETFTLPSTPHVVAGGDGNALSQSQACLALPKPDSYVPLSHAEDYT